MPVIQLQKSYVQNIALPDALKQGISITVLRLDAIHPTVSGNKWFKLQDYIKDAQEKNKKTIATFGGAYSNHILATAAVTKETGFDSIGIIRGEEPEIYSPTLVQAKELGMNLIFTDRKTYGEKKVPPFLQYNKLVYIINEGGYGQKGAAGAAKILEELDTKAFDYICAATGTGTMLAGLINAAGPNQHCIGISALKNNYSVENEINALLPIQKEFSINYDYHFGGYAKYTSSLINFMNFWYEHYSIPTDFVYTGKLFFAVNDLVQKNYFKEGSKLLLIHSGGLQGNRSLPKGTLIFQSN